MCWVNELILLVNGLVVSYITRLDALNTNLYLAKRVCENKYEC